MKKSEEIIDHYLKDNEWYFEEEYDADGFPVESSADELIGNLTNQELCDMLKDAMEHVASEQRKEVTTVVSNSFKKLCRQGKLGINCKTEWLCDGCKHLNEITKELEEQL